MRINAQRHIDRGVSCEILNPLDVQPALKQPRVVGMPELVRIKGGAEIKQRYAVVNMDDAIALYESNYYDRIPEEIYQTLLFLREKLADTVFPKEDSETK